MSRTASAIALCWLLADAAPQHAAEPAPPPRPAIDLVASATVAERLLTEEYGADAKGVKGAKVKFAFRTAEPNAESETGEIRYVFAFAAEEISFPGDGVVTVKNARLVLRKHFPFTDERGRNTGWVLSSPEPAIFQLQFAGPVRSLEDLHNAILTRFERPKELTFRFDKVEVKVLSK